MLAEALIFCTLSVVSCEPTQITTQEAVRQEIVIQSVKYGVDTNKSLKIADCESDFNPYAKNPNSTAKGVFQFTNPTWKWIKATGNQFNYKENVRQFMIWYPRYPNWWEECLEKI